MLRKSIFDFSQINRMSPFLDDGIGWNGKKKNAPHQVTWQTKQCRKWPCCFWYPLTCSPVTEALGQLQFTKRSAVMERMCFSGGHPGQTGGGGKCRGEGSGNKNKACFRRYSLAALSCYSENSVLSLLQKWPQLSLVRPVGALLGSTLDGEKSVSKNHRVLENSPAFKRLLF